MAYITENLSDGISVSVSTRESETQLISNHIHNYNEIYYLCEGTARFFIGSEIINIREGDIVFVRSGILHKTMYTAGQYTKRLLVCFNDDFAGDAYTSIITDMGAKKYIGISPLKSIESEKLMQRLLGEFDRKKAHHLQMCACILGELLITLSRQRETDTAKTLNANDAIMQSAAKYITDNYSEDFTLTALAERFAMSPSHFSKTFKSSTGFGVSEYITAVRLANAEKMLLEKKISVTEVASRCGYNDSNYFASVFKNKNGITPHKFAAMHRN